MENKVWRRGQSGHKAGHTRLKRTQGKRKADTRQTHGGNMVAKVWGRGQSILKANTRADICRTRGGHMADKVWRSGHRGLKADTGQTQGGHMEDTWRTRLGGTAKADSRRTQGRHKADRHMVDKEWPKRTQGGHKAHGGHEADELRGRGQSISRPAFFQNRLL